MPWYKTGTVTVSTGDNFVTGIGTNFTANARVGDGFRGPDGKWYEIVNIPSSTVLGIYPNYSGASVSADADYMVAPLQGYNKESADRLRAITDSFTVVTSVAGRTGDVVVNKSDVGLSNVDNTSDVNKPISTATQAELNLRTPTTSNLDQTSGRIVKVGDYGRNGGLPIDKTGTDANLLTVEGLYYFASGTNAPSEACVVNHIPTSSSLFAKQIAYGTTSNSVLQRVKNNGTWGSWTQTINVVDNLASTSSTSALSAYQGNLINVALLNRYTKTESDARYYTQAQVDTTYGTRGFIEGLVMTWNSSTSISISAGSAYIPSVQKIVQYAGGTIVPGSVLDVNTFLNLYLTSSGTIISSLTAPVVYYGGSYVMSGDNSRRYIGSLHVTTNANGVTKFVHRPELGMIYYTLANPQIDPFKILASSVSIGASFTVRPVTPVTAHTIEGAWQNTGNAAVRFTPSDAGTSVTTGWCVFVQPGAIFNGKCPIAPDGTITVGVTSGGVASAYCLGYYFNR